MINTINYPSGIRNKFTENKVTKLPESKTNVQQNVQFKEHFSRKFNSHKSSVQVDKFLKNCVYQGKSIHPKRFCRRWFGLEDLDDNGQARYTEELISAMESEHGYREKCINLIARVLKIKPNTVHRWGKGVEFDKIPSDKREQYEVYLGYVDSLRVITVNLAGLNEEFLLEILRRSGIV